MKHQEPIQAVAFQKQDQLDTWDKSQPYQTPQLFSVGKAKDLMASGYSGWYYDFEWWYYY